MAEKLKIEYGMMACFSSYRMEIEIDPQKNLALWTTGRPNHGIVAQQEIIHESAKRYISHAREIMKLEDKGNPSRSTTNHHVTMSIVRTGTEIENKSYIMCDFYFVENPGKRKLYPLYYAMKLAGKILADNFSDSILSKYPLPSVFPKEFLLN